MQFILLTALVCFLSQSDGRQLTKFVQLGGSGFRQGSPDPSCANRTLLSYDPPVVTSDNFYKEVTKDRVHILATEVDLYEESPLYDPCKDFYLETVRLRIKGHLRWKAANIYISAVNITVVGEKAVLDVSYQAPGTPDFPPGQAAPSGTAQGAAGQPGAAGGAGKQAGNATLYLGVVHNGTLEVLSRGGPGGRGQDGGDGHEGAPGEPAGENSCCHSGRSTTGGAGGKGGDGGAAGKSGSGGAGGVITIYTLDGSLQNRTDNGTMSNITVPLVTGHVDGGNPGQPATPGKPAVGGPGGAGSKTHCKKPKIGGHHSCHGDYGPNGPQGPSGKAPAPTPPGAVGVPGSLNIYGSDLNLIGQHISSELVQMALREANKYYKNSEFEGARDIYAWIHEALVNSTDPERRGYARKAGMMLIQMSKGLDFWAHSFNNMPMNSYTSIFNYLNNYILPYLKDVEKEYRIYFSAAQNDTRKLEIARNLINHNKFTMNVIEKNKQDLLSELQKTQSELEALIHQQTLDQQQAEGMISHCQYAIKKEIEKEKSRFTFKEIFKIATACVKIYAAFYDGGTTLYDGVDDLKGAIDAFNALDGGFIDKLMDLHKIETIVHDFHLSSDFDKLTGSWDEIVKNYREIEGEIEKHGQENSAKIFTQSTTFDKQYDKWLYLPECSEAKIKLQTFLNMTQSVNDKIMHHDAIMVKLATVEAETKVLEFENARLRSQMTKDFDPNLITYSIAVGRVLYNLKDAFVDQMKRLHESYTYQFLERRPFAYDDSSVAMLEAWMANNVVNRLQRMEQIGNQVEQFNVDPRPLENSILLHRADHPEAFKALDENGTMTFVLRGDEDQLSTMTHAHMTDVKVWLPGVKVDSDHLRIWFKRYGTSQVYDQQGNPWTFTHGARTMLFDYGTMDHSSIGPKTNKDNYKANTKVEINEEKSDYVALSPIGPWSLSVSKRYNPGLDTTGVDAIYLQLSYSFLPCAQPECPIRSLNGSVSDAEIPAKQISSSDTAGGNSCCSLGATVGVTFGVLAAVLIIIMVILYIKRRGLYTSYTNQGGLTYNTI